MDEFARRLAETAAAFPFPESEVSRAQGRRWILSFAQPGGIGAEIGVFRGHFSEIIMATIKPRKLYLVDPWTLLGEFFEWGAQCVYTSQNTLPTRVARQESYLRAKRFPDTEAVLIEGRFPECRGLIREKLDWVYLDASHAYEDTLKELNAVDEMLAPDGVIIGDDWAADRNHPHHGIFRAVNEFVKTTNYEVVAAGPYMQWCIRRGPARSPNL